MALTTKQINALNRMNRAAQNVALGTVLNDVLYGSIPAPAAGTITNMSAVSYKTTPAAGSAVAVKAAFALTAGAQAGVTAGITSPDFPRNVTIKGNASGITGNVKVYGTNFADAAIDETIALNGATEVAGAKAFKTVTKIDFPAETHAGTDTVSIGRGVILGFPVALSNAALCPVHNFDGAVDAGTVTGATTVEGSTYTVAGTMNGTKIVELVFFA